MAAAAVAVGVKALFDVAAGLQQAEMIRMQGELSWKAAQMNAKYAELDAWKAELQGYSNVARYKATVDAVGAAQDQAYATQNVDSSYGTAAEVKHESQINGIFNSMDIMEQAHARALGYQREARNILLQGKMGKYQTNISAQQAIGAGITKAIDTGISGYTKGAFDNFSFGNSGGGGGGTPAGANIRSIDNRPFSEI